MSHAETELAVLRAFEPLLRQSDLSPNAASNTRLHEFLNLLPVAIYITDASGRIWFYNEAAATLWGCRPELGKSEFCGSWKLYWPDGTPLPHDECPMALALKQQRPIRGMEAIAERPDGTQIPFVPYPTPLFDDAGVMTGAVNMLVDITERRAAESLDQRLALVVESSDDAIISKDLNGIIATWNNGAQRLFGYTADEVIGKSITILIPRDRQDEEIGILACIRRGERIDHYETVRRRKDGSLVEISLTASPVKNAQGRIVGVSKIARDITERKLAEQRISLLAREVDHRAKNLLAMAQATVHLTQADTPQGLKDAIEGRLQALASAHTLLAQSRWAGADLRRLVEEELSPYCRGQPLRAQIDGENLELEPTTAQLMAVALHELATNAVKYGALSVSTGHVHVEWRRVAEGRIVFRWAETGGPPVKPPARRGFGTRVIERMIRDQLKGDVRFDWRADGLICEIAVKERPSGVTTVSS